MDLKTHPHINIEQKYIDIINNYDGDNIDWVDIENNKVSILPAVFELQPKTAIEFMNLLMSNTRSESFKERQIRLAFETAIRLDDANNARKIRKKHEKFCLTGQRQLKQLLKMTKRDGLMKSYAFLEGKYDLLSNMFLF